MIYLFLIVFSIALVALGYRHHRQNQMRQQVQAILKQYAVLEDGEYGMDSNDYDYLNGA